MLKIKIPFGFKTLQFDCVATMYTGKIRVKIDFQKAHFLFGHIQNLCILHSKGDCVTISYMISDYNKHLENIKDINSVLCRIMHDRIDEKYFPEKKSAPADYGFNDLCF